MIPATVSASYAFMIPVATPPNAIAFSYGYLKVYDMVSQYSYSYSPVYCSMYYTTPFFITINEILFV